MVPVGWRLGCAVDLEYLRVSVSHGGSGAAWEKATLTGRKESVSHTRAGYAARLLTVDCFPLVAVQYCLRSLHGFLDGGKNFIDQCRRIGERGIPVGYPVNRSIEVIKSVLLYVICDFR